MKKSILAVSIGAAISFGAQANIIISEYVEGSSNNKAIEITNTGSAEVNLADGYVIGLATNGKSESEISTTQALYGILKANESIVLVNGSSSEELKAKGIVSNVTNFNGDDALIIKKGDVIVDSFGQLGTDPGYNWGSGDTSTKDKTLRRTDLTPRTDATSPFEPSDFFAGFAKDTFDDLQCTSEAFCSGEEPPQPPVEDAIDATIMELQGSGWSSTVEGIDVPNRKYESTNFYKVRGVITAIQTTKLGNDLPTGFFIQDETGDGDANTSDGIFVQGSVDGLAKGQVVDVVAKVKEDYGWTKLISPTVTPTETTSTIAATAVRTLESDEDFDFTLERHEGMLVKFDKESDMRVSRTFGFDYGPKRNNMVVSNGQVNLHPNQNNAPVIHDDTIDTAPETQSDCNQDKRIVVESFEKVEKGTHVPWYPNFGKASAVPMPDGTTTTEDFIRIGDVLDGFEGVVGFSYNDYRFYVTNEVTKDNFIRENSARTEKPALKEGGDLRIATFNVLNYFNSPFGGDCNPTQPSSRDSISDQACSNRGAASEDEFDLQGDKIAKAIATIDADIVGLMEIENNGFGEGSAVADLIKKINAQFENEADHYAFVTGNEDDKFVGSDAIANQVIFRPAKVTLDTYRLIEMPQQHAPETTGESGKNYQRDSITPTFMINGTEEKVTVSVNHFKSKGSKCWEDAAPVADGGQEGKDPDKQGSCENFRVSAAYHLGETLKDIEGHKLILGDLNAYGNEDPVMVLTNRDNAPEGHVIKAARDTYIGGDAENGTPLHGAEGETIDTSYGYINIIRKLHPDSYSYSYNDEVGTLDYILITPELESKVIDATDWNINAGESTLFQYANKNNCLGDVCSERYADQFRASDHDPAIIDLKLAEDGTDPEPPVVDPEPPVVDPEPPVVDPEPETPVVITPPSKPVNPPADLPAVPEAPVAGEPIKVMMDLTDLGGFELHAGDKAILNIAKITTFKGAFAGGATNYVVLTEEIIKQGWVELQGEVSASGDYQMTKVIDGVTGQKYVSEPVSLSVADSKDSVAVDPHPEHDHGGSTGLFGLLSLLGLGFLRRKVQK